MLFLLFCGQFVVMCVSGGTIGAIGAIGVAIGAIGVAIGAIGVAIALQVGARHQGNLCDSLPQFAKATVPHAPPS